jgi:hypothetical protein
VRFEEPVAGALIKGWELEGQLRSPHRVTLKDVAQLVVDDSDSTYGCVECNEK